MSQPYNTQTISTAFNVAKNALILLPENPTLDAVASSLSLYLSLSSRPLSISIGCVTPMTVNFNRLFGVDKISPKIGNQNLVISFSYPEDSLEKVSYDKDTQNQKLHLTIEPKPGHQPLDSSKIEYSYTGSTADIIFIISATSLESLGEIYFKEKSLLDNPQKAIFSISNLPQKTPFGDTSFTDPISASVSEITYALLKSLNLTITSDIATNLLSGIKQATNNYASQKTTATTFQTIADLINQGANQNHILTNSSQPSPLSWPKPASLPVTPPTPKPLTPSSYTSTSPFVTAPTQSQPVTLPANATEASPRVSSDLIRDENPRPNAGTNPSPDWLKPKVFNSSNS